MFTEEDTTEQMILTGSTSQRNSCSGIIQMSM